MTRPVSIVIPARSDRDLLERHLPDLLKEVERRDSVDEVLLVDDTGDDVLRPWVSEAHPLVRGVVHNTPRGWGKALLSGAHIAKHPFVLCLAPDVRVHEGFLEPLTARLEDESVFAVSPRVVPAGDGPAPELRDLMAEIRRATDGASSGVDGELTSVNPHAFLARREDLLEAFRVEPAFEPVFVEPLAPCLAARSRGLRVAEEEQSVVEHHPREPVEDCEQRTALAKNRLLALWTQLDDPERSQEHLNALWRCLLDPSREGWTDDVAPLLLALDHLPQVATDRERIHGREEEASENGTTVDS